MKKPYTKKGNVQRNPLFLAAQLNAISNWMISEMTENASSNPASGVTQGSRRDGSTCAINRWLVLGRSGASSGVGWIGEGVGEAAGAVCRGTSILAIPFLGSGMLTNYRGEPALCQHCGGAPLCAATAARSEPAQLGVPGATSTLPWNRFDFSFALTSQWEFSK